MPAWPDFTVRGALSQTWDLFRHRAGRLIALSATLYALPTALLSLLPRLGWIPDVAVIAAAASAGKPIVPSAAVALIAYGLASVAVVFLGSILAGAGIAWAAHEGLHGRPAGFGGGVARAFRVLPAAIVMFALSTLGVVAGFCLFVVPGVMLFLRWSAALPALAVERAGILGSLGRSRDLTRGHRWAILGFLLLLGLIDGLVLGAAAAGGAAAGRAIGGTGARVVAEVLNVLVDAVVSAVGGAGTAALYFELRRAGEGTLSAEAVEAFA